ncbi:MAG: hypothetical protein A2X78_01860 [Gammaproteobacteria bacterium GWE2_37_16]|nr:MAG: hypothetical protein A2X78_01860 [Gammaproteobacteria bacterium GWE2_37_16]
MRVFDWLMVIAVLFAPLVALRVQTWIEDWRSKKIRQLTIFKTLMTTRANRLSTEHVQALNMIDLEFYSDKKVIAAWKKHREHFYPATEATNEQQIKDWVDKSTDLFVDLLIEMGEKLGYKFSVDDLKSGAYLPKAHGHYISEQEEMRKNALAVLSGKQAIYISMEAIDKKQTV